jgi:HEAT repeat protein
VTDAAGRRRAAALAGHAGDHALATRLLGDDDPGVRATALGALDRLDRLEQGQLDAAAADPAPPVRRRAAELAAGRSGPDADRLLLVLLGDADATVVEVAAWASGERAEPSDALLDRLRSIVADHDDALCREAAVAALGSIGDERALPTILAALGDRATVRRRAVIALAPFDHPDVEAALRHHLTDRDRQVRQAAEDLLGRDA